MELCARTLLALSAIETDYGFAYNTTFNVEQTAIVLSCAIKMTQDRDRSKTIDAECWCHYVKHKCQTSADWTHQERFKDSRDAPALHQPADATQV